MIRLTKMDRYTLKQNGPVPSAVYNGGSLRHRGIPSLCWMQHSQGPQASAAVAPKHDGAESGHKPLLSSVASFRYFISTTREVIQGVWFKQHKLKY